MCRWLRRIGEFAPLCYSIAALAAEITSPAWSTGLDLTLANNQGHTALHKAAYKGHDGLCRWLIANTALGCSQDAAKEPEEPTVDICAEAPEWPANHIAPECSLCDRSKDRVCCVGYRRDAGGYTPAMIAREQRHEALAEWLQLKQDESAARCGSSQLFQRQRQTEQQLVSTTEAVGAAGTAKKMQLTGPLGKLEEVVSEY